jgi:hypothetical protein
MSQHDPHGLTYTPPELPFGLQMKQKDLGKVKEKRFKKDEVLRAI